MMQEKYKEIALLRRLSKSDEKAFAQLYEEYYDVSYHFILSFIKDSEEARDIAHDIFVKIWLKRELVSRVLSFKSYLFRILKNAISDYFESQEINRRFVEYRISITDDIQMETENRIDADELQLLIFQAVSQMPPQKARIFSMSRYERASNKQIAQTLGIGIHTVENNISSALSEIRQFISRQYSTV